MLTIGGKITGMRRTYGFSQRSLARETGVAQSTISLVEQGKRDPDLDTIRKLAKAFGVRPLDLLDGVDF